MSTQHAVWVQYAAELERFRADNARLREALKACVLRRRDSVTASRIAHQALDSTDASQWLRGRERRVAERVREAMREALLAEHALQLVHRARAAAVVSGFNLDALLKEET